MSTDNLNDNKFNEFKFNGWKQVEKDITFDGGTLNGIGDEDGTNNPFDIFTVTGFVRVKIIALCTTDLTGNTATLALGVTAQTASIIAITGGTTIDAGDIWHDTTPDAFLEATTVISDNITSKDIIGTVGINNIVSGVIRFICLWQPISEDGKVEVA